MASKSMFLPDILLNRVIQEGRLTVIDADGDSHVYQGDRPGPVSTIRMHDKAVQRRLFLNPELRLGEAYMDGALTVEEGDIYDFLDLVTRANADIPFRKFRKKIRRFLRPLHTRNRASTARSNVAHHYDLDAGLYDLFLDSDRQYSCGYFGAPGDDIESAQLKKRRHLAAKLRLQPDQDILDIGCGWGGMALYLAQMGSDRVDGVTLSEEQLKIARQRAVSAGLDDRLDFRLEDYRDTQKSYDRIISVGMFEHVGPPNYDQFFEQISRLLKDDGVAVIHAIGRSKGPGATSPWLRKYIFPGGYIPALSETLPSIERAGLWVTDIEILRLHYAETCKAWRARFLANWDKAEAVYDSRFCRMWNFYLAGAEIAFRNGGQMVFQIQLAKRVDALPITRDYMVEAEAALAQADGGASTFKTASDST